MRRLPSNVRKIPQVPQQAAAQIDAARKRWPCKALRRADVPPLPAGVVGDKKPWGDVLYDHDLQRWRFGPDGELKTFIRYYPNGQEIRDAGGVAWQELWTPTIEQNNVLR